MVPQKSLSFAAFAALALFGVTVVHASTELDDGLQIAVKLYGGSTNADTQVPAGSSVNPDVLFHCVPSNNSGMAHLSYSSSEGCSSLVTIIPEVVQSPTYSSAWYSSGFVLSYWASFVPDIGFHAFKNPGVFYWPVYDFSLSDSSKRKFFSTWTNDAYANWDYQFFSFFPNYQYSSLTTSLVSGEHNFVFRGVPNAGGMTVYLYVDGVPYGSAGGSPLELMGGLNFGRSVSYLSNAFAETDADAYVSCVRLYDSSFQISDLQLLEDEGSSCRFMTVSPSGQTGF